MSSLAPVFRQRFFSANGAPLAGGKVYTYAAGSSTPLATYTDNSGTTPNANPIILDANGECDIWINSSTYKIVLKDSLDVTQWTKDNIGLATIDNGFTTGDVKISIKTVPDNGWIMMNDLSIGNAASGATGRANADTATLYALLWNNIIDAWAPVSTGRGASAAADYAANKTITLPKTLGRALAISGAGAALTARVLGSVLGEETHVLTKAEMPVHTHIQNSHQHTYTGRVSNQNVTNTNIYPGGDDSPGALTSATTAVNQNEGGDGAHNNMQPTTFLNVMIKL